MAGVGTGPAVTRRGLEGAAAVLLVLAVLWGLGRAGVAVPLAAPCLVAVAWAAGRGGMAGGMAGAGLVVLYALPLVAGPSPAANGTAKFLALAVAAPTIALLIGGLRHRLHAAAVRLHGQARQLRMFELSPDAQLVNLDGIVTYANPPMLALCGARDAADLVGRPVLDLVHETSRGLVQERLHQVLKLCQPAPLTELRWQRLDGTVIDVEVASAPLPWDGAIAGQVIARDVSRRKQVEEALRRSEETLQLAREAAGFGIWDWTVATGAIAWSPEQWAMFGLPPNAAGPGRQALLDALHPEDRDGVVAELMRTAREPGRRFDREYRILLPDGQVRWLLGRATAQRGANGAAARVVGINMDITARKSAELAMQAHTATLESSVAEHSQALAEQTAGRAQAEAALHQSQKMEALGQLTGGVVHDINNLLAVMGNVLRPLQGRLPDARTERRVELGLRTVQSVGAMVQRLLAFARQQPLHPTPTDLRAHLEGMGGMLRQMLGGRVVLRVELDAVWPVVVDANAIEVALLNLLSNARDATPAGGKVTVAVRNHPSGLGPGLDAVALSVSDTGTGMTPAVAERVFEPFFTTKEAGRGTGLGLSQVYGTIKQSGGDVRLRTAPDEGTTITLLLPRGPGAAEDAAPGAPAAAPSRPALPETVA